jgi:hypothetical protein
MSSEDRPRLRPCADLRRVRGTLACEVGAFWPFPGEPAATMVLQWGDSLAWPWLTDLGATCR